MKPMQSNNKLVSSVNNTTSFKMETSAETFEIFSSQIYEHKARAIIRELSCNANDSHVDAGKRETPFRIHFPTMFEPWFEVEDFGVGLDDYDIRGEEKCLYDAEGNIASRFMEGGIYTTYFASTKRDSNESIGHLGLGSKSPMAYTKSMTVVARKDGMERHYVCFVGEDGQPQTTFNSEIKTDECNGVKVRFSVASADFDEFRREAQFVLSLFAVQPETNVEVEPLLSRADYDELKSSNVLVLPNNHPFASHETATVYANMGGVVYPVRNIDYYYLAQTIVVNEDEYNTGDDADPIYHTFDKETVKFIKNVTEQNSRVIIVNFPIGDLSFMPSREGLSQDSKTKYNLYKGLTEIFHAKVVALKDNIASCTSRLHAVNTFGEFSSPTELFSHNYNYDGISISVIAGDYAFRGFLKTCNSAFDPDTDSDRYFTMGFKDYTGKHSWNRKENNPTCVRKRMMHTLTNYDMYKIMQKQQKFDCFYADDYKDYRGLTNAIRFYLNQKDVEGERVFFFYTPVKPEAFDSLQKIMYGNVNFRHISELVEEVKKIEPTFFDKILRGKQAGGRKVSSKNETKSNVINWNRKHSSFVMTPKQVVVDLSKMNPSNVAWVQGIPDKQHYRFSLDVNGRLHHITERSMYAIMQDFGIKVLIVANGRNAAKITRSGLPLVDNIIADCVTANERGIIRNRAYTSLPSVLKMDTNKDMYSLLPRAYNSQREIVEHLFEIDVEYTKPMIDYLLSDVKKFQMENMYVSDYKDSLFEFVDSTKYSEVVDFNDTYSEEILERANIVFDSIKRRFPLLFGIDSEENAVLEYVKMVNEKSNMQMKVA